MLKVTTRKFLEEKGVDLETESYESVVLSRGIKTKSGTYSFDESGGDNAGKCEYHPQYDTSKCPYCLDEAVVIICQRCGAKLEEGQVCSCKCMWCRDYPCTCSSYCPVCRPYPCTKCKNCGAHYCFGACTSLGENGGDITLPPDPGDPCRCQKCPSCQKCINPPNSKCSRCSCPRISIQVSAATIDLGEKIRISVAVSNISAACEYIEYDMLKNGDAKTVRSYNSNLQMSVEEMIRQLGKYAIKVGARFGGDEKTYYSNEVKITCVFLKISAIKELGVVRNGMDVAWTNTLNAADTAGVREYGGVVVIHT